MLLLGPAGNASGVCAARVTRQGPWLASVHSTSGIGWFQSGKASITKCLSAIKKFA